MKLGPLTTAVVAILAMAGVVAAFVSNASPYVTVAQAREMRSDRMHLAGDILKETVKIDLQNHHITFVLRDEKGEKITVLHKGDPPANMGSATKVVAIGGVSSDPVHGERFVSDQLLLKCPSKYEEDKKSADVASL